MESLQNLLILTTKAAFSDWPRMIPAFNSSIFSVLKAMALNPAARGLKDPTVRFSEQRQRGDNTAKAQFSDCRKTEPIIAFSTTSPPPLRRQLMATLPQVL